MASIPRGSKKSSPASYVVKSGECVYKLLGGPLDGKTVIRDDKSHFLILSTEVKHPRFPASKITVYCYYRVIIDSTKRSKEKIDGNVIKKMKHDFTGYFVRYIDKNSPTLKVYNESEQAKQLERESSAERRRLGYAQDWDYGESHADTSEVCGDGDETSF